MKILQVNCVYGRGSTGKIVADIHKVLLENGEESIVCYGRKSGNVQDARIFKFCTELESKVHNLMHRYFNVLSYGGCFFSTQRLISIIKKEQPEIVHLQCINGYCVNIYKLLRYLAKSNIKTVVTNHAEFFYTGSCGHAYECVKWTKDKGCGNCPILLEATASRNVDYTARAWQKMKDAFSQFKKDNIIFTAVSPWVKTRFAMSPITRDFRCEVVENGLETSIFNVKQEEKCLDIKKKFRIPLDKKMVFHATASFTLGETNIKGGRYVLELAKRMPNLYFVVAALLYDNIDNCPSNLLLVGAAKNQKELATLYSAADVSLLTSKRETFSMVTAESLCCGTPIVGFKAGGPESIALPEYSIFVEYGNVDALKESLIKMLSKNVDAYCIESEAKLRYSKEIMTNNYNTIYKNISQ